MNDKYNYKTIYTTVKEDIQKEYIQQVHFFLQNLRWLINIPFLAQQSLKYITNSKKKDM